MTDLIKMKEFAANLQCGVMTILCTITAQGTVQGVSHKARQSTEYASKNGNKLKFTSVTSALLTLTPPINSNSSFFSSHLELLNGTIISRKIGQRGPVINHSDSSASITPSSLATDKLSTNRENGQQVFASGEQKRMKYHSGDNEKHVPMDEKKLLSITAQYMMTTASKLADGTVSETPLARERNENETASLQQVKDGAELKKENSSNISALLLINKQAGDKLKTGYGGNQDKSSFNTEATALKYSFLNDLIKMPESDRDNQREISSRRENNSSQKFTAFLNGILFPSNQSISGASKTIQNHTKSNKENSTSNNRMFHHSKERRQKNVLSSYSNPLSPSIGIYHINHSNTFNHSTKSDFSRNSNSSSSYVSKKQQLLLSTLIIASTSSITAASKPTSSFKSTALLSSTSNTLATTSLKTHLAFSEIKKLVNTTNVAIHSITNPTPPTFLLTETRLKPSFVPTKRPIYIRGHKLGKNSDSTGNNKNQNDEGDFESPASMITKFGYPTHECWPDCEDGPFVLPGDSASVENSAEINAETRPKRKYKGGGKKYHNHKLTGHGEEDGRNEKKSFTQSYGWIIGAGMVSVGSLLMLTGGILFCYCTEKIKKRRLERRRQAKYGDYERVESVSSLVSSVHPGTSDYGDYLDDQVESVSMI